MLTSCQALLVFFLGEDDFFFFFHFSSAEHMFYLTGIQSKSTNVMMPSQGEGNGGESSMSIWGWSFSDRRGSLHS